MNIEQVAKEIALKVHPDCLNDMENCDIYLEIVQALKTIEAEKDRELRKYRPFLEFPDQAYIKLEEEIAKLQGDNQELRDILNGKDAIIASLSGKEGE